MSVASKTERIWTLTHFTLTSKLSFSAMLAIGSAPEIEEALYKQFIMNE